MLAHLEYIFESTTVQSNNIIIRHISTVIVIHALFSIITNQFVKP